MSRIVFPFEQCLDDNGNPLSGCRAYSFQAGTSTPLELYSDAARTVSHGAYVEADSAGRFPAAYGDPANCYRLIFRESDGVTLISDENDICPPADSSDTSEAQAALGFGTAASQSVGTSGNAIPLLNGVNTWSGQQTFTGDIELQNTSDGATIGPSATFFRDSASPAADDIMGGILFAGNDSTAAETTYVQLQSVIQSPTDTSEGGFLRVRHLSAGSQVNSVDLGALSASQRGIRVRSGASYIQQIGSDDYPTVQTLDVDTATASSSATLVSETIPAGTKRAKFYFRALAPANDDVYISIQFNNSGVADTGSVYSYMQLVTNTSGAQTSIGADDSTAILIGSSTSGRNVGNATNEQAWGWVEIVDPLGSGFKFINWLIAWENTGNAISFSTGGGMYFDTDAVDGITVSFEAGNIASGEIDLEAHF